MSSYYILNIFEGRSGFGVVVRSDDIADEDKTYYVGAPYIKANGLVKGMYLDDETLERLSHTSELRRAVRKAADILSLADYSKIKLVSKLTEKGFDRSLAIEAALYMEDRGYIKEAEQAARLASFLAENKLRGKKRIAAELSAKGYNRAAVKNAVEQIPDEKFREILTELIRQKYKAPAADRRENDKRVAALMRCGFEASDIIRCLRENDMRYAESEFDD
ncbi:MAG: RecX family transcriptional regulator [Clostridia bacterium]|nr:RecX family transcriptional regulator [Clostridia bacterium]